MQRLLKTQPHAKLPWLLAFVMFIPLLLTACHTAHVAEPLTKTLGGNEPDIQLAFWHSLADRPITSNDEAFHGLLLYLDGQDASADYAARVQTLKSRNLLPAHFNAPADAAVDRGTLAVAICRSLKIKGGLMLRLTNTAPRYAVRELQFMDLYPLSSPNQTFSGAQFLGIIGRMEDYQRGTIASDTPATPSGPADAGPTAKTVAH